MLKFGKRNLRIIIFLFLFYIISWHFLTFRITDVPPGINGDEAGIGYTAALISKTGYDSNGKFLPIFTTIAWPDWKQPVTLYSTVIFFKLFGISYFNLRAVSVFFVLLSGTIIFFLVKELFDKKFAILSLLIFMTIPIIVIQSHLALENIGPLPFISFWLLMLVKYQKQKRIIYLILSASALGMSIYSYLGLRLIMPVLAVLSIFYIYYLGKIRPVFIFLLSLLPFLLFLLIIKDQYPAAAFALNRPQDLQSYQQFLLPFISSFDLSFLFMKGDSTSYHSTGKQGMFLLATLPLFLLGLFHIAKIRKPIYLFILAVFFLSPILYGLPGSIYRASRLLSLIPAFIVICMLGIKSLLEIKGRIIRFSLFAVIITLVLVNYSDFLKDYWFEYPNRIKSEFGRPYQLVFGRAASVSKAQKLNTYIEDGFRGQNPSAVDFFELAYFPGKLKLWQNDQLLPPESVIIAGDRIIKRDKINQEIIGEFSVIKNDSNEQR